MALVVVAVVVAVVADVKPATELVPEELSER